MVKSSRQGLLAVGSTTTLSLHRCRRPTGAFTAAALRQSKANSLAQTTPSKFLVSPKAKADTELSVELNLTMLLRLLCRAAVHQRGPHRTAAACRLLCSLHLRGERKPRPQYHLAVQRRAHWPDVAALQSLRVLGQHRSRDAAGRGRLPVSAGRWRRLGHSVRDAHGAVRCVHGCYWKFMCYWTGKTQYHSLFSYQS